MRLHPTCGLRRAAIGKRMRTSRTLQPDASRGRLVGVKWIRRGAGIAVVVALAVWGLAAWQSAGASDTAAESEAAASLQPFVSPLRAGKTLPTITLDRLPRQAIDTLVLIKQGGPFPYRRDGITFENRERRLPSQSKGYYREYTVRTPGSSDRGARRIIAGRSGERFYTPDHYRTFYRIVKRS